MGPFNWSTAFLHQHLLEQQEIILAFEMMKFLLVIGFLVVAAQALGANEMEDDMKLEPRYYLGYAHGSGNYGYGRHRRNKQPKKVGYWGGQYGDAGAELEKDIKQYLKTYTNCYRSSQSPSDVTTGLRIFGYK